MNSGNYRNQDYPIRPVKPYLKRGTETAATVREYADALAAFETNMVEYNRLITIFNTKQRELDAKFKVDVLAEYGLTGNPKANDVFELAWEEGHSSGYSEVMLWVCKLASLVK
jgi:hypothetical protein